MLGLLTYELIYDRRVQLFPVIDEETNGQLKQSVPGIKPPTADSRPQTGTQNPDSRLRRIFWSCLLLEKAKSSLLPLLPLSMHDADMQFRRSKRSLWLELDPNSLWGQVGPEEGAFRGAQRGARG